MCGRIHFGPCLVNGDFPDGTSGPMCMTCGARLTRSDRDQIQATWDVVNEMLRPYKRKASQ